MASATAAEKALQVKGVKIEGAGFEDIQLVSEGDLAKTAASDAFMMERVTIMIMETTDAKAPPYADVGVDHMRAIIPRGVPFAVPRCIVEVLARMREDRYTQSMDRDGSGEITMGNLRKQSGLAFPFTVIEDKNPKGGAWLANILADKQ